MEVVAVTGVIGCPLADLGSYQASRGVIPLVTGVNKSQGARHPIMHGRDQAPERASSIFAFPYINLCNVIDIYVISSLF